MTTQALREGAIYSIALTPHQYVARALPDVSQYREAGITWVLVPYSLDARGLLTGPVLFVTEDGTINRAEGKTPRTVLDLDFTGRYADGRQPAE